MRAGKGFLDNCFWKLCSRRAPRRGGVLRACRTNIVCDIRGRYCVNAGDASVAQRPKDLGKGLPPSLGKSPETVSPTLTVLTFDKNLGKAKIPADSLKKWGLHPTYGVTLGNTMEQAKEELGYALDATDETAAVVDKDFKGHVETCAPAPVTGGYERQCFGDGSV